MALSGSTVWEVRTAGSDTNGGGFVTGASGTDFSQQDSKNSGATNKSVADVVATGVATITSATAAFTSAIVGNIVYLSGTGITTGWYQVVTYTNGTTVILDRSPGTGTGGTINIGGALLTISQLCTNLSVGGMIAYIKAGTYSTSSGFTQSSNASVTFIGYSTTRGDNGQPTLTTSHNSTVLFTQSSSSSNAYYNLAFSVTATTAYACFQQSASASLLFVNCSFTSSGTANGGEGIYSTAQYNPLVLVNCVFTACEYGIYGNGTYSSYFMYNCLFYGNTYGLDNAATGGTVYAEGSIFYSNQYGIYQAGTSQTFGVNHCAFVSNTSDGIYLGNIVQMNLFLNSIFYANSGYGFNQAASSYNDYYLNNAFGSNNGGGTGLNYVGTLNNSYGQITLTADPFVSKSTYNFALNSTGGGGAACQSAGFPGVLQKGGTGYADVGALRHQDPSSYVGGSAAGMSSIFAM